MMGAYVTTNQLTTELLFTASSDRYAYGEGIDFEVRANGTRFVDDVAGVYVAVQVQFAGADGEAMGEFHNFSSDLAMTTNCASSLYSQTASPFEGLSTFSWTPSYYEREDGVLKTTGNATFKLVWANGVGGSDPYAEAIGVPDTYLYLKTLTILAPDDDRATTVGENNNKEAAPLSGCVQEAPRSYSVAGVRHSYRGAPVAVQQDGSIVATSTCVACREGCGSAVIECPTVPGAPVKETVWYAERCEGVPARVSETREVACPAPEFWHPRHLDLERFVAKLLTEHPTEIRTEREARRAIDEYRKLLELVQQRGAPLVPSRKVDLVWHAHILDTRAYAKDARRMFGRFLHHAPAFGDDDRTELLDQQRVMMRAYQDEFGTRFQPDISDQKSPDCCAANCVKPNCAGCVGCNAIDCGYYENKATTAEQIYVAAKKPMPFHDREIDYSCGATLDKLDLAWSVVDDVVYFKLHSKVEAWFGIGLGNTSGADMSQVDYMISLVSRNFTGVKDLWKWDDGNGYPCFDVEYECSANNATAGTGDLENVVLTRDNGYTTATWSRAAVTPDAKDWPITDADVRVLFSYGEDDYFTYHNSNFGACHP
ncbi:hypothetical protein CTAYLR_008977, partial [Chrysophaeum taylorii]